MLISFFHSDKIEVLDPLGVEDLISDKLNNRRKLARLIKHHGIAYFPIFRKAWPFFFRVLENDLKELCHEIQQN